MPQHDTVAARTEAPQPLRSSELSWSSRRQLGSYRTIRLRSYASARHLRLCHTAPDGIAHQARRFVNIELAHELRAVRLDRLGTDAKLRGDVLGRTALGDELQHLPLPHGESI